MSTDNAFNAVSTVKGETAGVVDSVLNTQSHGEVKVIESRAENSEITSPIDNTTICKQTNEDIGSPITGDSIVNVHVEKTTGNPDSTSTVQTREGDKDDENCEINSTKKGTNGSQENLEENKGNIEEIETKISGNECPIVQECNIRDTRSENNPLTESGNVNVKEVSDESSDNPEKKHNIQENIDNSCPSNGKILNKAGEPNIQNHKSDCQVGSETVEQAVNENSNEKTAPEKEHEQDVDNERNRESDNTEVNSCGEERSSQDNAKEGTVVVNTDDENHHKKESVSILNSVENKCDTGIDGIDTDEIEAGTLKTSDTNQGRTLDSETSGDNHKESDENVEKNTENENTISNDALIEHRENLLHENQVNGTTQNPFEDTSGTGTQPTITDENELEIQRELERVYNKTETGEETEHVRTSSAPESTHESDRGHSTELVIKTAIDADDEIYDDDFEEVDENDTADVKQAEDTCQTNKEGENSDDNLSQLEQDIQIAKTKWENGVKGNERKAENNDTNSDIGHSKEKDIDSEIESTIIVVEGEGIPQVYLSTVPDRPPSSEPDLDDKRNPQEEVEEPKHSTDTEIPTENSETTSQQDKVEEDPSKPMESVDTEDKMDGRNRDEKSHALSRETKREESTTGDGGDSERDGFYDNDPGENKQDKYYVNDPIDGQTSESKQSNDTGTTEKGDTKYIKVDKPSIEPEKTKEELKLEQITKKEESPLEQLLKRHVEIDGSVESITELEQAVTSLLGSMRTVMSQYQERLKLQALRDFTTDLGSFRGDFKSVNEAYKRCSSMSANINQQLKELRHVTDDIRLQISRKFQNEDLSTWIDSTPEEEKEKEKLQELNYAAEKAILAKASEAKHAMATASIGVAEAQKLATETEVQYIEAEATATKAAAQARAAILAVEEARIAALERARVEEASRKRAEERARVKAEEEKRKKEQEDMKIIEQAALKGSSVEDERKQYMEEKERKEAERRNPKNWPRFKYNVKAEDFDPGVGCVIRAIEGSIRENDVTCAYVSQSTNVFQLQDNEELVGNIVTVKPTDDEMTFNFEEPFSIAIPVCNNRLPLGKECVIKHLTSDGKWKTLPTAEVQFEDLRELKFVEGRSRSFGTFVTVLTTKKDTVQFTPKAFKAVSSVDSRITFSNRPGSFKHTVSASLEVQAIDVNAVSDLKVKVPTECDDLLTASPFINLRIPIKRFEKPVVVTMPLPQNQARQKRPMTGMPRESKQSDMRPSTARPASIKDDEELDAIHFLYMDDKNGWMKDTKCNLHQPKNKDVVSFEMTEPRSRFILLRTKPGTKDVRVEKIATLLEKSVNQKNVKLFLRQRHDDAFDIKVGCTASNRVHRALKSLEEDEGYTEGPAPSGDLVLQEGQQLFLKFRGNIGCVSEDPDLTLIYNSNIRACRQLFVEEIDKFAQKGLQNYRGFLQVLTKAMVPDTLSPGAQNPKGPPEMVEAEVLLCELLIELPKPEAEPPKPLKTAPLPIQDGPLTSGVLKYLAGYLGKEWKDLALHLNLKPMRIQAILRQNVNKDTSQTRYDMLMAWAKRIPKSVDKVQILCSALQAVGRADLVEEVRYRGDEFRQKRQKSARASHLRQAFVKVAKTSAVFSHWQKFAKGLGVPEDEIRKIEGSKGSGQEKCYNILETWKSHKGEDASVVELASHLRSTKHEYLSREIESIMTV